MSLKNKTILRGASRVERNVRRKARPDPVLPALKRLVADTEAGKASCAADRRPPYSFSLIVQRRDRSLSQLN
jgi:hypothetical protein